MQETKITFILCILTKIEDSAGKEYTESHDFDGIDKHEQKNCQDLLCDAIMLKVYSGIKNFIQN